MGIILRDPWGPGRLLPWKNWWWAGLTLWTDTWSVQFCLHFFHVQDGMTFGSFIASRGKMELKAIVIATLWHPLALVHQMPMTIQFLRWLMLLVSLMGLLSRNRRSHVVHKCSDVSSRTLCNRLTSADTFERLTQGCLTLNARCSICVRGSVLTTASALADAPDLAQAKRFRRIWTFVSWKFDLVNAVVDVAICLLNIFFFSVLLMRMSCQFAIWLSGEIAESSYLKDVYTSHPEQLMATVGVVCSWKRQCILCSKELNSESAVWT